MKASDGLPGRVLGLLADADPAGPADLDRAASQAPDAASIMSRADSEPGAASGGGGSGAVHLMGERVDPPRSRRRNLAAISAAVAAAVLLIGALVVLLSRDAAEIEPADTTTTGRTTTLPRDDSGGPAATGAAGPTTSLPGPEQAVEEQDEGPGTQQDGQSAPGGSSGSQGPSSGSTAPQLPAPSAPPAGRAPHPAAVVARTPLPSCGTAHLDQTEDLVGDERLPVECFYYWVDRDQPVEVIMTGTPPGEMEGTVILRHIGGREVLSYRNFPDSEGVYSWSVQGCHKMTRHPTILRKNGPGSYCDTPVPLS